MEQFKKDYIKSIVKHIIQYGFSEDVAIFIGCQFALESNYGRSNLAVTYNNHCGMKYPLVRPTLADKIEGSTFAKFDSLFTCLVDYVLCITHHQPLRRELTNLNLFKSFIRWYCPEKTYINLITNLFNSYKNESKE